MTHLKTINQKPGYIYSNGSAGKCWRRGNIMYSEGKKYTSNNEYIPIIAKTNLDTGDVSEATLQEAKRFLTEEGYKEYVVSRFAEMAQRG
jgi:hypothetical protein